MKKSTAILLGCVLLVVSACSMNRQAVDEGPDTKRRSISDLNRGALLYRKGCYQRSLIFFFRAYETYTANDLVDKVALCLNNIGNVYRAIDDTESAVLFFDEAYDLYAELKDDAGAIQALSNKAAALIAGGRLAAAEETLGLAENAAQAAGMTFTPLLNNRGILLMKQQEFQQAEKILREALANADPANPWVLASVNFTLGNLMCDTDRCQEALDFFNAALEADRAAGFYKGIADDLAALGETCTRLGKNRDAVRFYKRSAKIYALTGDVSNVGPVLEALDTVSKKEKIDTTLTKYFVNQWMEKEYQKSLCD